MVAVSLTAVEGLVLLLFAVLEIANLTSGRVTMAVSTSVFFLAYGLGLIVCAAGLYRLPSLPPPPQMIISLPVHTAVWKLRPPGAPAGPAVAQELPVGL